MSFVTTSSKIEEKTDLADVQSDDIQVQTEEKKQWSFLIQFIWNQWPLLLLTVAILTLRLRTMPNFIESRDGSYFVSGLQHYSVSDLSPHWPGYPVYIWLGDLFHLFISDPVAVLHVLSVIASTLTLWPIAALASSWKTACGDNPAQARLAGFTAAVLWAFVPLSWISGSEIFSDPLAIFLAMLVLWYFYTGVRK